MVRDLFFWLTKLSHRVTGSKIQVAGWPMYVTVLWGIKASICCFFSRLAQGVHGYRIVLWIGYIFIGSSYVVLILAMLLSCQPGYKMWQIYPDPGNICQPAVSKVSIFMVLILNITTDIYLLVLPLKLLWGIKLPPIKKAGVVVLFSGAIFIIVAGILRCVFILSVRSLYSEQALQQILTNHRVARMVHKQELPGQSASLSSRSSRPIFQFSTATFAASSDHISAPSSHPPTRATSFQEVQGSAASSSKKAQTIAQDNRPAGRPCKMTRFFIRAQPSLRMM